MKSSFCHPTNSSDSDDYTDAYSEEASRDPQFNNEQDSFQHRAPARTYKFVNRNRRCPPSPNGKKKWRETLKDLTDDQISTIRCCKKRKCFANCNSNFLRERAFNSLGMNNNERTRTLSSMLGSNGKFMFDGRDVCAEFLAKAFRFSRHFQCKVKGTPSTSIQLYTKQNGHDREAPQQDMIVSFLERLSESTADKMPDSDEYHLPFFSKTDVYDHFLVEQKALNNTSTKVASRPYFFRTWKQQCFQIKVRKLNRFTKCSLCEELRSLTMLAISSGTNTEDLKNRKTIHNSMVSRERREYKKKRDMSILSPSDYMSIIVDGADQSAFGLPHFTTSTKEVRGFSLKVRLIGVLEHGSRNKLHLFTMTEEFETGANHVIEAIHRFLCERRRLSPLPSTLYVQMDNCSRENKNKYMFSYFEALVLWKVVSKVEVSFLPIGHTHEDIDQTFSCTSRRLKYNDAITLSDLMNQLKLSYNENTTVNQILNIVNWSGLVENSQCIRSVKGIKSFRYFKFTCSQTTTKEETMPSVTCSVRPDVDSDWRNFILMGTDAGKGFLKFLPDLSKTPPTVINLPIGKDDVTKRVLSEEGRINDVRKVRSLLALRDTVFNSRIEPFHWNLTNIVETEGPVPTEVLSMTDDNFHTPSTSYDYDINSFVAVRPEQETRAYSFWIAKIQDIVKLDEETVTSLHVHWYQPKQSEGELCVSRFAPSFLPKKGKERRKPWCDKIPTDSVIVQFNSLTTDNRIPSNTQKLLRENATTML